jgi:hypothetical protein
MRSSNEVPRFHAGLLVAVDQKLNRSGRLLLVHQIHWGRSSEWRLSTRGGLIVGTGEFFIRRAEQLVALAARHRMPAIYQLRDFAAAGGLISYGASVTEALSPRWHLHRPGSQGREAT